MAFWLFLGLFDRHFFEIGLTANYLNCLRIVVCIPLINDIALFARQSRLSLIHFIPLLFCTFRCIWLFSFMIMPWWGVLVSRIMDFLWMLLLLWGVILIIEQMLNREGNIGVPAINRRNIQEEMVAVHRMHLFLYFRL